MSMDRARARMAPRRVCGPRSQSWRQGLVLAAAGVSRATAGSHPARGGLQGKIEYCTYCHGASGQGYRAYYTMPRLAGQTPEYIENQLRAYAGHRRKNPIMADVARALSPGMQADLARHFASLRAAPSGHGGSALAAKGKKIFEEGLPDENVPACAACHGLDAHGYEANPRLAGQLSSYIQAVLATWDKQRGHETDQDGNPSSVMAPVARSLTKSQAAAVGAYLSSLK